ncbi:hypothetical protein [Streptomyces sp. WZ-12]|uniref:hypothetical protein n=1 Tax=Streptomyces sp. WZ-12 TaxID=3030210 RepID=UPI0023818A6C|nr:hypothetical protein [Streptomyces sp. WZ-12]
MTFTPPPLPKVPVELDGVTFEDASKACLRLRDVLERFGIKFRTLYVDEEGTRPTVHFGRVNVATTNKLCDVLEAKWALTPDASSSYADGCSGGQGTRSSGSQDRYSSS